MQISGLVLKLRDWITRVWSELVSAPPVHIPNTGGPPIPVPLPPPPVVQPPLLLSNNSATPLSEPTVPRARRRVRHESATTTVSVRWRFRRDILDRLDEYFGCIKRMRVADRANYDLLSKTGLAIPADGWVNPDRDGMNEQLSSGHRPSFGGVLAPLGTEEDRVYASFVYFSKLTMPGGVQAAHGDIYALSVMFDRDKYGKYAFSIPSICVCHLAIDNGGHVTLLREATQVRNTLYRKAGNRKERLELQRIDWRYPIWLSEVAAERHETPEELVRGWFVMALCTYVEAHDRITIRAKRHGLTATFGIELPRCPRFFADRDATATAKDGRRKRIFHSVIRHERHLAGDRTVQVTAHYRGIRVFDWNGYRIGIVWPKTDIRTFTAPGSYQADIPDTERRRLVSPGNVGKRISDFLDS